MFAEPVRTLDTAFFTKAPTIAPENSTSTIAAEKVTGVGEKTNEIYHDFDYQGPMEVPTFAAPAGPMRKAHETAA
jgi:hypothetical protein